MAFGDRILTQARQHSVQLERAAAMELNQRLNEYLPPSYGARMMADAYAGYADKGTNSTIEYQDFRSTFSETKSLSHQVFSKVIASHIKPERYPLAKSMFETEDLGGTIKGAVRSLNVHGMWKARFKVPAPLVDSLKAKTLTKFESLYGDDIQKMLDGAPAAPAQIKSNFGWLTTFEEMFELASDPLLLTIIHQYMGVPPIFDTPVVFLNSAAPLDEKGLSAHAQLYHHDMHRLQFVKLFVYLTDVDDDSGPHAMIPGTHRNRPDALWADGRHSDAKVAENGILQDELRIRGRAGTLFMVDTSALHKGVHPDSKARLLAQVQYSNSMFGRPQPAAARVFTESRTRRDDAEVQASGALVRKYAEKVGVRFMQALI